MSTRPRGGSTQGCSAAERSLSGRVARPGIRSFRSCKPLWTQGPHQPPRTAVNALKDLLHEQIACRRGRARWLAAQLWSKALCRGCGSRLSLQWSPTNIYTQEDAQFLTPRWCTGARADPGGGKPALPPHRPSGRLLDQPGRRSKSSKQKQFPDLIWCWLKSAAATNLAPASAPNCGSLQSIEVDM